MTSARPTRRTGLGVLALGLFALGTAVPACSTKDEPTTGPKPSSSHAEVTIMMDGHTHTISGAVECSTRRAQANATPTEYGNQTTHVSAKDDAASVTLSFSDATPPDVDSFAISLTAGHDSYQMPLQSPSGVEAARQGKSYTVTGTGRASAPGHGETRDLTFGIHVTCP